MRSAYIGITHPQTPPDSGHDIINSDSVVERRLVGQNLTGRFEDNCEKNRIWTVDTCNRNSISNEAFFADTREARSGNIYVLAVHNSACSGVP
jgi:hypothetical protein